MTEAWRVEFTRLLILSTLAIIFGLASGAWVISLLISTFLYIGWTLVQIRSFERWIRLGASTDQAPDTSGIWEIIVQHIYRSQKKDVQDKLRLSTLAKKFENTISALPDATIVLNSHLEIEWSNQAAVKLLGIKIPNDLGQRIDNLIRKPELQLLLKQSEFAINMQSPLDIHKTLVMRSVDFGDQQKLIIAKDISPQIAIQKLRKNFIANASHELRTPLTVISGYLEMLADDDSLPANIIKPISNANKQAARMQKIINDMLQLTRLEENRDADEPDWIDVADITKKLISDLEASQNSHRFELELKDNLKLKAPEDEIHSLCQNLLSNAIKYSPDGSVIKVSWQLKSNGDACFKVIDSGEGIALQHLSRLTERFFRVNAVRSRKIGGTGLGLSIVKHILDNHNGWLDISSVLGKGSTFTAYFPKNKLQITKI